MSDEPTTAELVDNLRHLADYAERLRPGADAIDLLRQAAKRLEDYEVGIEIGRQSRRIANRATPVREDGSVTRIYDLDAELEGDSGY